MNSLALTRSTGSRSLLKTVRQTLKHPETALYDYWVLPTENDNHFVYHMEDLSDYYHEPYDETHPGIRFDETNKE